MNFSSQIRAITNTAMIFCQKHSPEILTGLGITGAISSTVLAVRATPKALEDIHYMKIDKVLAEPGHENDSPEKAEEEAGIIQVKPFEIVRCSWKHYIPAAVTGACSIACIVGAQHISLRRNALIAGAYAISEATLKEYKDQVTNVLGEKSSEKVRDSIAEKDLKATPVPVADDIPGEGTLCFDPYSGRYFKSSMEYLREKVNDANYLLNIAGHLRLNDWYDILQILEDTKLGWDMVWELEDGLLEFHPSTKLASNGEPCIVVDFLNTPTFAPNYL